MYTKIHIILISSLLITKALLSGPCCSKSIKSENLVFAILHCQEERKLPKKNTKIKIYQTLLEMQTTEQHPNYSYSKKAILELKSKIEKYKNSFYTVTKHTILP